MTGNPAYFYERELVPAIFGIWAPVVVDFAPCKAGETVLDLACGTGAVTRVAAQRVGITGTVVALDVNGAMLAMARTSISNTKDLSTGRLEWHEGDAHTIPFPTKSFDAIYCAFGLQLFSDRTASLREMHRALKSQGRIALSVWAHIEGSPAFHVLAEALERHISADASAKVRGAFALHDPAQLRTTISEIGFQDVMVQAQVRNARFRSVEHFVQTCVGGSRLNAHLSRADHAARGRFVDEIKKILLRHITPEGLTFPIEAHIARAKK
jgi:ubiquinone/menaquinone biosynthesis C-methylase UbiE